MTVADGVSVGSAVLLAVGAFFAWRTFSLANTEHREAREEVRRAPRREFLGDVYRELKYLAAVAQERNSAGSLLSDKITGQQRRLQIALAFLSEDDLPLTRELAEAPDLRVSELVPGAAEEVASLLLAS